MNPTIVRSALLALGFVSANALFCLGSQIAKVQARDRALERTVAYLNRDAAHLDDTVALDKKLKKRYRVNGTLLRSLRGRGLNYGDLSAALSVSNEMFGGSANGNIESLITVRQGPPSLTWGEIARMMHVDPARVAKEVRDLENLVRSQEARETADQHRLEDMEMDGKGAQVAEELARGDGHADHGRAEFIKDGGYLKQPAPELLPDDPEDYDY